MTDLEFDILDELYFVESFQNLQQKLEIEETLLCECLEGLLEKDWVKCFSLDKQEMIFEKAFFKDKFKEYCYLATKEGLMAHHSKH